MRITAFTRYGRQAASTRQRLLQYVPLLEAAGIEVDYQPLLDDDYVRSLAGNHSFSKLAVLRSYARRIKTLLGQRDTDLIWIYSELFPYLPGAFEKLAFRSGKPVVYDFDDAFFHTYDASPNALVRRLLARKLEPLLSGAAACCCGNAYLLDYAKRFCERSIVLPTVVDTEIYRPAAKAPGAPLVLGWIGSPTTFRFLEPLLPILAELAERHGVGVRVVGAGSESKGVRFPGLDLVPWSEEREVADVQEMDVGIMPLPDEIWARGKSGYKLVQYMACGLPVVASPVGVNREIVRTGENGFLASSPGEWREALETLVADADLRACMGAAGRRRAQESYSTEATAPALIALLRQVQCEVRAGG